MYTHRRVPLLGRKQNVRLRANPWVACVTGLTDRMQPARAFLDYQYDYREMNARGSRGTFQVYHLEDGHLYEVEAHTAYARTDHYFCTVHDYRIVRLTRQNIVQWIANGGSASMYVPLPSAE